MKRFFMIKFISSATIAAFVIALWCSIIPINIFGQTTYTTNPAQSTYTALINTNTTCNNYTSYGQNALKMAVGIINGNQARFLVVPESGSFSRSGTCYIKLNDACGSVVGQTNYSAGSSSVIVTINLSHTSGTISYVAMTMSDQGWRNHTRPISITASTTTVNAPTQISPTQNQVLAYNTSSINFQWNKNIGIGV